MKRLAKDKHTSLFCQIISSEEKVLNYNPSLNLNLLFKGKSYQQILDKQEKASQGQTH